MKKSLELIARRKEEIAALQEAHRRALAQRMGELKGGLDWLERGATVLAALLPLWRLFRAGGDGHETKAKEGDEDGLGANCGPADRPAPGA